jgi:hypothetical protein
MREAVKAGRRVNDKHLIDIGHEDGVSLLPSFPHSLIP